MITISKVKDFNKTNMSLVLMGVSGAAAWATGINWLFWRFMCEKDSSLDFQDLSCLFELYLEPLQSETFLTQDEVNCEYFSSPLTCQSCLSAF